MARTPPRAPAGPRPVLTLPSTGDRAARQGSLREHNLGLVLSRIGAVGDSPTRADLAKTTGLTRAAVSELVDILLDGRMVRELAPSRGEGPGRPGVPLALASRTHVGVGLDVAVDHIVVCAIDLTGLVVTERAIEGDFRNSDPARVLERLARVARNVIEDVSTADLTMAGMCVSVPGLVGPGGHLLHAPNLGWHDVAVARRLATDLGIGEELVRVGNDASLAATGESAVRERAGDPRRDFLYISGQVGIGAAVVLDGALSGGMHGWGGEIGHTVVDPAGPMCGCGATGCLEQYAGTHAILRRAGLDLETSPASLRQLVLDAAPRARAAVDEAGQALGRAAAGAVNLLDVDTVILGGAYAPLYDLLEPTVSAELRTRAIATSFTGSPVGLEVAQCAGYAAARGAAYAIVGDVIAHPTPWLEGMS